MTKVELKDENEKHITLPCFSIKVILVERDHNYSLREVWLSGSITSDLKEVCEHCNDINCELNCPDYNEWASDRDEGVVLQRIEDKNEWIAHRAAADTLESFILNAAIAGIPIEEPAFVEAIESTHNALTNNL